MVISGQMQNLVASPRRFLGSVCRDPVPGLLEARELLHVPVQQLSWRFPLVAHHRGACLQQVAVCPCPPPCRHAPRRCVKAPGVQRCAPSSGADVCAIPRHVQSCVQRCVAASRTAVNQPRGAMLAKAPMPLASLAGAQACCRGSGFETSALYFFHQTGSTFGRQ
jgi:hypothetical protein